MYQSEHFSLYSLHSAPACLYHICFDRFLVVQVYVPLSKDFAVELGMTDINNSKRRLMISTSFKDLSSTPLHAKLPLNILKRDTWLNLCFDLRSFINEMFPNQTFKSLEEFTISGDLLTFNFFSCAIIQFLIVSIATNV